MLQQIQIIKQSIKSIPDYPKPGIIFRDITSLMQNAEALTAVIDVFADNYQGIKVDKIVGTEARGFIFGAALAVRLGAGFVPVRKAGKLPREVNSESYQLEYGEDVVEIHKDAISSGETVLLVDDLIATGGTIIATANLVEGLGGSVLGAAFVINLPDLGGAEKLIQRGVESFSICEFEGE